VQTAIAAINTGVSGILALMHNSGLPDRYRSDRNEFYRIEEHLKSIVDSGLVPVSHSVNDALAECFEMFATALQVGSQNLFIILFVVSLTLGVALKSCFPVPLLLYTPKSLQVNL
jgi:hypothetical protein